jgi:hypothetical protein
MQQLTIDFTSQSPINTELFTKKNSLLYNYLNSGNRINHELAQELLGIKHLHSRIAEVRKFMEIECRYVKINGITCKEYWKK